MELWALDYHEKLGVCRDRDELNKFDTWKEAWDGWERGDDLLWMAVRMEIDRKLIVLAACDCAEISLKHIPVGEDRPKKAIDTARDWAKGEKGVSLKDVEDAASAASSASSAAYAASAASSALRSAASAAYAAYASAYASAYAAAYASDASAAAAARKECADIVRKHITFDMIKAAYEKDLK